MYGKISLDFITIIHIVTEIIQFKYIHFNTFNLGFVN